MHCYVSSRISIHSPFFSVLSRITWITIEIDSVPASEAYVMCATKPYESVTASVHKHDKNSNRSRLIDWIVNQILFFFGCRELVELFQRTQELQELQPLAKKQFSPSKYVCKFVCQKAATTFCHRFSSLSRIREQTRDASFILDWFC